MTTTPDTDLLEDGLALSSTEKDFLQSLLDGGDRAGFYAAYGAMVGHAGNRGENGSGEALLQAKISSFSDDVGAVAYYANALLQMADPDGSYPGIYKQSQIVAQNASYSSVYS